MKLIGPWSINLGVFFTGRDGLTHNMLDNIHDLWKRKRVCKIKCKGVCTVDMDNVRRQLEVGFSNLNCASSFLLLNFFWQLERAVFPGPLLIPSWLLFCLCYHLL